MVLRRLGKRRCKLSSRPHERCKKVEGIQEIYKVNMDRATDGYGVVDERRTGSNSSPGPKLWDVCQTTLEGSGD